ncbi:MAG TPA: HAD-IB family hydrolase [Verrucomicrobiae bacterium]|nr:HAD-IB family hydrolase [Verrucomicrobiae bacterium]
MQSSAHKVVAVFDFDGTITCADSLLPFCRQLASSFPAFVAGLLACSPILVLFALGAVSNHRAKEVLLRRFLRGHDASDLDRTIAEFIPKRLDPLLNRAALDRIAWHQSNHHQLIILSASPELYLVPWAGRYGISAVLGTRFDLSTSRISGRNCRGAEKIARLEAFLGPLHEYDLHVYADSSSDLPLLDRASQRYWRSFDGFTGWRQRWLRWRSLAKALL